jgi:hypothetical protein
VQNPRGTRVCPSQTPWEPHHHAEEGRWLYHHSRQEFVRRWMLTQAQHSRFGKGPLEVSVPDVFAGSAQAFARCFLGTLDQATISDKILAPWEAVHVMDVIVQHEAETLPNTGHGLQ